MARFYRYRLPPWARHCLLVAERCTMPLMIFQGIRAIFFPTTFDVLLLAVFVLAFFAFYLKWI